MTTLTTGKFQIFTNFGKTLKFSKNNLRSIFEKMTRSTMGKFDFLLFSGKVTRSTTMSKFCNLDEFWQNIKNVVKLQKIENLLANFQILKSFGKKLRAV